MANGLTKLKHRVIACCFAIGCIGSAYGTQTTDLTQPEVAESKSASQHTIQYFPNDNDTNHIPYLDHRFRIDADLDEIKLIFYRKPGSKPVILVQPDGKKIRVNHYDKEKIEWFDDVSYDMIRIVKPMPGPWQAIGQILPQSEILVVSDVKIIVPPLPPVLLSGETLKIQGKLVNGDEPIINPHFQDVVELIVEFYSTNNSAYDNFGAEPVEITRFRDDGLELDEYKNDGIFTGEFHLNIPAGEWIPVYRVEMPMAQRELKQKPVIVQRNPISFTVDMAKKEHEQHVVHININSEFVDASSLIFQGKITFPDKRSEPFSLLEDEGVVKHSTGEIDHSQKEIKFGYTEPGIHKLVVSAFGKTRDGREFRLEVPQYSFNVPRSDTQVMHDENDQQNNQLSAEALLAKQKQEAEQALLEAQLLLEQQAEQKAKMRWIYIGVGNGVILLIAIVLFVIKRKKQEIRAK
jgi:uncharacterized protein (TIGR03503 family)